MILVLIVSVPIHCLYISYILGRYTGTDFVRFNTNNWVKVFETTEAVEQLQKLKVRLWQCKIDSSPPVILYYCSFQGDTSVVVLSVLHVCLSVLNFCAVGALCMSSYF